VNKSLIEIEGVTILNRSVRLLKPLFGEILVAGWPSGEEKRDDARVGVDNFPGRGPLAGIEAALKASETPYIFVFGGDMPWLSQDIITRQAEYFLREVPDVLVPLIGVMTEPLHSIYKCSLQPVLEDFLNKNTDVSVRDFYLLTNVSYFSLPGTEEIHKAFTNINTESDLGKLI
jgi:molybdopterin-guanine dinucleotide biosynthesis protein A